MLVRLAVGPHGRRSYDAGAAGVAGVTEPGVSVPPPDVESVGVGVSEGEAVGEADADGDADGVGDAPLVDGVADAAGEPLDAVGLGVSVVVDATQVDVGE